MQVATAEGSEQALSSQLQKARADLAPLAHALEKGLREASTGQVGKSFHAL